MSSTNLMIQLWRGDAGLAKSYWFWGVAAGIAWGIVLAGIQPAPGSASATIFVGIMVAYFGFAYVGIWRAASKYDGKRTWALLAKVFVALGASVTFLPLLAVIVEKAFS